MRSLLTVVLLGTASSIASAQDTLATLGGFSIGVGLGPGNGSFTASWIGGNTSATDRSTDLAGYLRVGVAVHPRFIVAADAPRHRQECSRRDSRLVREHDGIRRVGVRVHTRCRA